MNQELEKNRSGESASLAGPLAIAVALAAGVVRLIPHPFNFTPVGALGLFGGARLRTWQAFTLPLVLMLATDALLKIPLAEKGYSTVDWVTPFIYGSFLVNVLIGRLLTRTRSATRIGGAAVLGSVQFFLVTNFGVWLFGEGVGGPYPKTLAGLSNCYIQAIPFFGGTLAGDLAYTAGLFGLHAALVWLTLTRKARQVS